MLRRPEVTPGSSSLLSALDDRGHSWVWMGPPYVCSGALGCRRSVLAVHGRAVCGHAGMVGAARRGCETETTRGARRADLDGRDVDRNAALSPARCRRQAGGVAD